MRGIGGIQERANELPSLGRFQGNLILAAMLQPGKELRRIKIGKVYYVGERFEDDPCKTYFSCRWGCDDFMNTVRGLGLPIDVLKDHHDIQNRYGFVLLD